MIMLQYDHVTISSRYNIIMLQYDHVTISSRYNIIMLQYHHVTIIFSQVCICLKQFIVQFNSVRHFCFLITAVFL